MKTTKNTMKEPILFVDDHHGQYMGKFAYEQLAERYKKQVEKVLSKEDIEALQDVENELHFEVCDELTEIVFKTESGQKWQLQYAEGGIWAIPACFMRSKEYQNFIGN